MGGGEHSVTSFKMAANDSFHLSQKRCTLNQIFCFRRHIFHAIRHIIWTLRSEDGHGNKNVKKGIYVENIKQQLCLCSTLFLYISWPSLHDYDVKMPDFTFYGERKQATTKFSFSFWTWIWLLGIQFRRVRLHFTKNVSWINRDEDWRNANSLFKQRFRSRRHPWILNVSKLLTAFFIMKYCTLSCAG